MMAYGVDYYDPNEDEVLYLVVDAASLTEAREKAISELKNMKIPKRNIRNIEELFSI